MIPSKMNFNQIRNSVLTIASVVEKSGKEIDMDGCKRLVKGLFPNNSVEIKDIDCVVKNQPENVSVPALCEWTNEDDFSKRGLTFYFGAIKRYSFSHFCHELGHGYQALKMNFPVFIGKKIKTCGVKNVGDVFKSLEDFVTEGIQTSKNPATENAQDIQNIIKSSFAKVLEKYNIDISKLSKEQLKDFYLYLNGHAILEKECYALDEDIFLKFNGQNACSTGPNLFHEYETDSVYLTPSVYEKIRKFTGLELLKIEGKLVN